MVHAGVAWGEQMREQCNRKPALKEVRTSGSGAPNLTGATDHEPMHLDGNGELEYKHSVGEKSLFLTPLFFFFLAPCGTNNCYLYINVLACFFFYTDAYFHSSEMLNLHQVISSSLNSPSTDLLSLLVTF